MDTWWKRLDKFQENISKIFVTQQSGVSGTYDVENVLKPLKDLS
jgi:hypothetical protein